MPRAGGGLKRVLIVEDDPEIAGLLAQILDGVYDVEIARDGQRALDRMDEDSFDVLVVDMVMPILDGLSLMRRMAQWGIHVPVVVSSGIPELAAIGGTLGAKAVLVKPYDPEELVDAIELALRSVGEA